VGIHLIIENRLLQALILSTFIIVSVAETVHAQIGLQMPAPPRTVQLFEPESQGLGSFFVDSTLFIRKPPPSSKRVVEMDSTATYVKVSEKIGQSEFYFPAVVDFDTYIRLRLAHDRKAIWKEVFTKGREKAEEQKTGAIELEIPVRIKNETFTRIFGSDRVRLRVTGNISFDLSGRSENRSGSAVSAIEDRGSFSPRFNQTQQFTIEGKIGEKVTVSVEQNSEATFDFENTLKLRYEGDEDEIIQSIEAGNIGLSLPSTKYVIFGASNKGLFGLKTDIRVGNLFFSGIASLEKGEQKKLTISGSSSESKTNLHDYDFIRNRYFFVDAFYADYFELGFSDDLTQWFYSSDANLIREIDVYKSGKYSDENARDGIAVIDPNDPKYSNITSVDQVDLEAGKVEQATFVPLVRGRDYEYDYAMGYIILKQEVRDNEVLAVAYETDDKKVGTLALDLADADTTKPYVLRLIKPRSMQSTHTDVWPLMMRNVYYLGGTNIEKEGFDVQVAFNLNGEQETLQQVEPRKSFLYLLGLDRVDENGGASENGDKKIDDNGFLINRSEGTLMMPGLQPFDPLPGSRFENKPPEQEGLADTNRARIYNTNDNFERVRNTKFEVIVISRSTKSTFDLGFNVLEGSEEVLLNGAPLKRNEDYLIDYFTGQLTLISNRAKRSSSDLEIKYEKATIFQLDKKTILGGRAEYRFWEDSFIGFTALYMNKSTLDQRVRVGQEPFRNIVWDFNTALKFKPSFLTDLANLMPIVETNQPSTLDVEAEFAQVLPNPNTLNNEATGDDQGVAFLDDFEGTKRNTTLGIRYNVWTDASPPVLFREDPGRVEQFVDFNNVNYIQRIDTVADKNRGRIVWFNPYNRVPIKQIWPNRDVTAETGQETDVLGVQVWAEEGDDTQQAWSGFMRSTSTIANQQRTKFLEIWVKEDTITNPEYARINIDLGQVSEDWYMLSCADDSRKYGAPSWRGLNTEDRNKNGVLDENEDTGIDGYPDGHPCDDPLDNWREPDRSRGSYDGINGTEGNSRARAANYPDSEDLDGDGQLNLNNDYFMYSFTLDPRDVKSKEWLSGETVNSQGEKTGWKQYRIPLKNYDNIVGSPDTTFQSVYFVRVWFSNLTTTKKEIYFATLDFVGNEWEEDGIAENDTSVFVRNDSLFSITVYNTEENAAAIEGGPEPYRSPPGVAGIRDRITRALSKEQSMVLRITDLQPGNVVQANKSLFGEILSLVNYKKLRMFVHGGMELPALPSVDTSKVEVYIRFGSDPKNYYEYGQRIYAGWAKINEFDVDLDDLSRTKFSQPVGPDKWEESVSGKEDVNGYYRIIGRPSMTTIRYFKIGVRNKGLFPYTGEVWLDELRVSQVRQESGTALRLSANLRVADLLTFNGNWESKDADFHDIKTQFGSGNTTESQNYSGVLNLHKFIPEDWGVTIPVDARASFVRSIPKYYPRSDVLTGYRNATPEEKVKSLFGLKDLPAELDTVVTESEIYGIGTTIKKRPNENFWLFYHTIDQVNLDVDYSTKNSRNFQTEFQRSRQWRYSANYNFPWGKDNFIEPFKVLEPFPILNLLSDQKIFYSPNSTSMSLSISDIKDSNKLRNEIQTTETNNVTSDRRVSVGYQFIPSISFSYGRSHKADADVVGINTARELIQSILKDFYFGRETNITQDFKMDYRPKWFNWFTPDYSYTSDFNYSIVNLNRDQKQSSSRVGHRVNLTFSPSDFVKLIYQPEPDQPSAPGRSGRPRPTPKKTEEEQPDEETKENEEEEKPVRAFPNPLLWIYEFFNSWDKIQTGYTWNKSITNSFISEMPSWKYQFGLSDDPGVPQDTSLTKGLVYGPSITDTRALQTSFSFNILKNVRTNFTHNYNINETTNDKTKSANESVTFFAMGENPNENFSGPLKDLRSFIPDWTVKVSGLEKFLFFADIAKTVSLDHARSGKYTANLRLKDDKLIPSSESFTHNFQPLVGVNISWEFGMSTAIRMNQSSTLTLTSGGGATRSVNNSFSVTASYATQGGFEIPIPIWPFKGQIIKNEINFSLTFDSSNNLTYQKQFNQNDFQETQKNNTWKLRPSATYRFNQRVSGSLFYETGVTENKISGKYSWNEFGITVNIAIRD